MPHAREHARADREGLESPRVYGHAHARGGIGGKREGCSVEGCDRPAVRPDERFERPLCSGHFLYAVEAWRRENIAAGRCKRCGGERGDSPTLNCPPCRELDAEACRRYRARKAAKAGAREKRRADHTAQLARDAEFSAFLRMVRRLYR